MIRKPQFGGSYYHNYKGAESIVLMAVVDAHYRFLYVNAGCNGRVSDGGALKHSRFSQRLHSNKLHLPPPRPLSKSPNGETLPYVFVGDDTYSLSNSMMKPYPGRAITKEQRIFNYRLSRARRVVENAFGILVATFRVYKKLIAVEPEKATSIVLATCVLHNFLR